MGKAPKTLGNLVLSQDLRNLRAARFSVRPLVGFVLFADMLERLSTGWSHPVDKKSLQIQKLEPILVARIYSI
jgi:hypothetical protein